MGIYGAGFKLVSILTLVPTAFTQVVFPIFADFSVRAPQKLAKALADGLRVMAEVSFPLAAGGAVLAPQIIALLYPADYAPAATVLAIIVTGNAFGFLAWILQSFLLALNHQRFCMWNSLTVARAGTGSGTVTSSSGGISCGTTCGATYASGAAVTLPAAAAAGSTFAARRTGA